MNAVTAYGLLAHGLIFGAIVSLLPLGILRQRAALLGTALALAAGIAPVMHGIFGTPSLTLLQLAILKLADRSQPPTPSVLPFKAALGFLVFCAFFYSAALGWGGFDPYAIGYQPWALLAALIPIAGILWWQRQDIWLFIFAIDLAGYASGIFANLWDVLLDPLLFLLALIIVCRQAVIGFIARKHR